MPIGVHHQNNSSLDIQNALTVVVTDGGVSDLSGGGKAGESSGGSEELHFDGWLDGLVGKRSI